MQTNKEISKFLIKNRNKLRNGILSVAWENNCLCIQNGKVFTCLASLYETKEDCFLGCDSLQSCKWLPTFCWRGTTHRHKAEGHSRHLPSRVNFRSQKRRFDAKYTTTGQRQCAGSFLRSFSLLIRPRIPHHCATSKVHPISLRHISILCSVYNQLSRLNISVQFSVSVSATCATYLILRSDHAIEI